MRLASLRVENFGCIERAAVEFGPGLNVLFGPNDLGKSTLAAAVRSVLLLQHDSSAAERWVPWHTDATPHVELVFVGGDGRHYRVDKQFGGGRRGSALLEVSNDGLAFTVEAKAREVDEKLRDVLGWGVAKPGGRGGPRGLPDSFLTQVLLAEQGGVAGVLAKSLADDSDESGKVQLARALQALAQDPLFKRVLDAAQAQVDAAFTETGKHRRDRQSPFVRLEEELRSIEAASDELRGPVEETSGVEQALGELTRQRDAAEAALARAEAVARRAVVAVRVRAARERLADVDAVHARAAVAVQRAASAASTAASTTAAAVAAAAMVATARADLQAAEASAQRARRGASAQQRVIDQQELEKRVLELDALQREAQATLAQAAAMASATDLVEAAQQRVATATQGAQAAQADLAQLRDVEAWLRLREAERQLAEAEKARDEAGELRRHIAELGSANGSATMPALTEIARLRSLGDELRVVEAQLGVGLTVVVRVQQPLMLRARPDGGEPTLRQVAAEATLEAKRALELGFGDGVEVSIRAGEAQTQQRAQALRAELERDLAPRLTEAGVTTIDELEARARAGQQVRELEARAGALAIPAALVEERAARVVQRQQALAGRDRAALGKRYSQLGGDEAALAKMCAQSERQAVAADATRQAAERDLAAARAQLDLATASGGAIAPMVLQRARDTLASAARERAAAATRLVALRAASDPAVRDADTALAAARAALTAAEAALAAAEQRRDTARDEQARRASECDLLAEQARGADRVAAQAALAAAERELAAAPAAAAVAVADDPADAAAAVDRCRRALTQVQTELAKAEARLERVGGTVVRDRMLELEQALRGARARRDELERRTAAWKLLRDTLRGVEDQHGTHLGRALAGPVASRFAELTAGRYGSLALGPMLGAQTLEAAGAQRAIALLSVGTQEQLATLLRLCIAEQLDSALWLDDHLTQTDAARGDWLQVRLREVAARIQIVVLTCHPADYLTADEMRAAAAGAGSCAAGLVTVVDLAQALQRR